MKTKLYTLVAVLLLTTGCISSEVKESVERNAARVNAYVIKMDSGATTSEQDKKLIYAIRVMNQSLNWNINDVKPDPDVRLILENLGLTHEGE